MLFLRENPKDKLGSFVEAAKKGEPHVRSWMEPQRKEQCPTGESALPLDALGCHPVSTLFSFFYLWIYSGHSVNWASNSFRINFFAKWGCALCWLHIFPTVGNGRITHLLVGSIIYSASLALTIEIVIKWAIGINGPPKCQKFLAHYRQLVI